MYLIQNDRLFSFWKQFVESELDALLLSHKAGQAGKANSFLFCAAQVRYEGKRGKAYMGIFLLSFACNERKSHESHRDTF